MSRSKRKPYIKDSTRCNKYWKRQATRALRRAKEAVSGMFYKNYIVAGLGVIIVGMTLKIKEQQENKKLTSF